MLSTRSRITGLSRYSCNLLTDIVQRNLTQQIPILYINSSIRGYAVSHPIKRSIQHNRILQQIITRLKFSSKVDPTDSGHLELTAVQFEKITDDTLESLTDYFDELVEQASHLQNADISYGDGVLTIKFGEQYGTYVINRQTPNKQIWLSSPKSGPKRYDFRDGQWIYKHDGKTLHELLNEEISTIIKSNVSFNRCSYSGKEHRSDDHYPKYTPD